MGQTPIYSLRWPELGDASDGPDGYQDLAMDTEAALKGQRDNAEDLAYTPTWRTAGTIQPYGMAWTARYAVRGGRCHLNVFGQMSSGSTGGGTLWMLIGLPVRSRASIPEQVLSTKLNIWGYNFAGFAYLPANSVECIPYFPASPELSMMGGWTSVDNSLAAGSGCPAIPGKASVGDGNFNMYGSYLV